MRKLSFRPGHHAIGVKQSKTFFQPYTSYNLIWEIVESLYF